MKRNSVQQFVSLRDALTAERDAIRARISEIDAVLGSSALAAPLSISGQPRPVSHAASGGPVRSLGLREAIARVTARRPLTLAELIPAVQGVGFRFVSRNPMNSLGAYLYGPRGKEHFRKIGDGFAPR